LENKITLLFQNLLILLSKNTTKLMV